mgnify:FL=1
MSQRIIDVSEHDGTLDWQKIKDAGYHAIIRVGFGRFDSGGRLDYNLGTNVSECERLGIPYGFYWYSYATSTASAEIEGTQCVEAIKGYHPSYPVYFDAEEPGTEGVAQNNALVFCDVIRNAGYKPGIYSSESWWQNYLTDVSGVNRWVAKWSSYKPNVECDLWQYDSEAYVPGAGPADVNEVLNESMLPQTKTDPSEPKKCPYCGQPIPTNPPKDDTPDVPSEDLPKQDVPEETGKLTYQQVAAEIMHHMVTHDGNGGHGYSQYQRWGDGTREVVILSDGTQVSIPNGDFDCSSAVIEAWELAFPGCTGNATYTGNMKECFLSTGLFEWHPMGDGYIAQTGDIYLNEVYHTAMCWSAEPDLMMQFSISENYSISGEQGDQTGWESNIKAYANYGNGGWDGKLVYIGPKRDGSSDKTPTVTPSAPETTTQIDVDGYWGRGTTMALQNYFGTYADGEVWHQWAPNVNRNGALTSGWMCDGTAKGSPVIRALQNILGVTADGIIGTDTIMALQTRMGTYVDGVLDAGSTCVQELQRRLNAGAI